jgi:hypothetical protein
MVEVAQQLGGMEAVRDVVDLPTGPEARVVGDRAMSVRPAWSDGAVAVVVLLGPCRCRREVRSAEPCHGSGAEGRSQ